MTRVLLIRHGACDHLGRVLAGRAPNRPLSRGGIVQARALAGRLRAERLVAVYTSPRDRARSTAAPIAEAAGAPLIDEPAFDEVDYGEWTDLTFDQLDAREDWRRYNRKRSAMAIPGGESLDEVQARAVAGIDCLAARHADAAVAVVTHAEVIRCILSHTLGAPLDLALRIAIEPASVSTIERGEDWVRVAGVNVAHTVATAAS